MGVGCYPNCRGGIDNRISCEKFMKIGPVKVQLHAGDCAMAGQIGLFTILNRMPNLIGIRYKAETWQSFFTEPLCIKMRKNGPDGIVTEVAKWCQSRHLVPKSAALMGGWGLENAWRRSTFFRHQNNLSET